MKKRVLKMLSLLMAVITICSVITSSFISVSAATTKEMSYVEFQADFYKKIFTVDAEASAAYNFYEELKDDKTLQNGITAWEIIHIADSPSHANESGLLYKGDFYSIALFDMLDASKDDSLMSYMFDTIYGDKEAAVYELTSDVAKMFNTPVNELDLINIYDFKKGISNFDIEEFVGGYKSEFESSFDNPVSALGITVDVMNSASEIIETIASYRAVANMRNGILQVLNAIAEDESNDKALRDAARNCLPIFHDSYNAVLNDIAKGVLVLTGVGIKNVVGIIIDNAWNALVVSIPVLREIGLAVKGFRILMNSTFDFDERLERYYKLEAAVKTERAVAKVVEKSKKDLEKNPNEITATMYMESVWFYQKSKLLGSTYFANYMEHHSEAIGSKIYYWIIGQYDDLLDAIENVKDNRALCINNYMSLENSFRSAYLNSITDYKTVLNDFENQVEVSTQTNNSTTDNSEFLKQELNYTCTLASAAMMLRRTAKLYGMNNWSEITERSLKNSAWIENAGMRVSFTHSFNGVKFSVGQKKDVTGSYASRKEKLISLLKTYPQGIVIYNYNQPHAVLLTRYDAQNDIFYCADPWGQTEKGEIALSKSSLSGKTQTEKVNGITSYWYVALPTVTSSSQSKLQLTVNYNVNGGVISSSQTVADVYKVVEPDGINVRSSADASSTKLGAIKIGTSVTVTETKTDSKHTWGKIIFNGKEAWIALTLNGTALATKTGTTYSQPYYVSNSLIYKNTTSSAYGKTYVYGGAADDLDDDTTFGLYRDGYTFKGWSLSATGGTLIDKNKDLKAEDLSPSAANKTVTVYAVWEQNAPEITDHTVDKIYLSSIPQKAIYYIGEEIDKSSIKLIVKHTDGSVEAVNSGFVCSPAVVSSEGRQQVTVTYEGKTATFEITATQSKTRANNATSKVASTGYLLPSSSSGTIFTTGGTYKGDVMQALCKDGDYYLCLFPWNATTTTKENGVLLWFKASDIEVSGSVPTATEYFSMNPTSKENATLLSDVTVQYRADGGAKPVKYNGVAAPANNVAKDTRVRVLFEMDGYYCIMTDKYTGFVEKNSVKLDTFVYTLNATASNLNVSKAGTIDISSIKVSESITDGTLAEITSDKFTVTLPSTDSVGQKFVVVNYSNFAALVPVSVSEINVKQLVIEKMPTKLAYVVGESFDSTGMVVKAIFDDGKSEDVTSKVTYGASFNDEGNVTVAVKYESSYAYIPVKVYEKPEIEILNSDGYAGEKIIVPVHYFSTTEVVVPDAFEMTVSYDASKMSYLGVENSTELTVTNVDSDTLCIKYNGGNSILNNVLANLEFMLSADTTCYNTSAKITIDKLYLADSLGNKFETVLTSGEIFNLGVEMTATGTDVQTQAPDSDSNTIDSTVNDSETKTEGTKESVQTGTVNIEYTISGCESSLFSGSGFIAVAILGIVCAAFVAKKKEE